MCCTSMILHAKKGKRARFERLHSSWNPELSASLAKRMKLYRNQRVAAATGALTDVSQLWRSGCAALGMPEKSDCELRGIVAAAPFPVSLRPPAGIEAIRSPAPA